MRNLPYDYEERVRAKLAPQRMRATLSFAGLIPIVYEEVKRSVLENVREFYWCGFDESGTHYDEESYARDVTSLDKNRFRASAKWLVNNEAITDVQMEALERLRVHRNDIAHEPLKYLVDPDKEPDAHLFTQAMEVLRDLHRFWVQYEIDIGTFEFQGHRNVTVDDVESPLMVVLATLIQAVADGLREADEQTEAQSQDGQQA